MAKQNRWQYLNDFEKNTSGSYTYHGKLFVFSGSETMRRRACLLLWLLLAMLVAVCIGSGCINGAGMMNTFYVIFPYIAEISCLFALGWFHCKLLTKGGEIREYIYRSTQPRIPIAAMLLSFFALAGLLLSLLYSFKTHFSDGVLSAVVYAGLKIIAAVAALLYRNRFLKLVWTEK